MNEGKAMTPEQLAAMLADRDAGTQGPWFIVNRGLGGWMIETKENCRGFVIALRGQISRMTKESNANARRIARVPDMEAEIIRLRAALDKAEARKVKALVWGPWKHGDFRAESIFGFYDIWGGGFMRAPNHKAGSWSDNPKAAAQADYDARILSALEAGK